MSEGSHFQLASLLRGRSPSIDDFVALLDLIPHAALLADLQSEKILVANSKLADLTFYTRSELSGLEIKGLFPDWDDTISQLMKTRPAEKKGEPKQVVNVVVLRRNKTKVPANLVFSPLSNQDRRIFLLLELGESFGQSSKGLQDFNQLWDGLQILINVSLEIDFQTAISQALLAGKRMTGADILAVYQAHSQIPLLQRIAGSGSVELLPEQLSIQEFIPLNKPRRWIAGQRSSNSLQHAARTARLSYLVSAPIGPLHAVVGLVVFAGTHSSPLDLAPQVAQLLGTAINTIFQEQARFSKIISESSKRDLNFRASSTLQQHMQEGVILLNPGQQILQVNTSAEVMLGYASREIVGQPIEKILIGTETLFSALSAAQQGSATYNLGDIRLYRRNGEAFLAMLRIFPVIHKDQVEAILILLQDLSEHEQIRMQAQQLEQRALLGEVTAIFAHEVRNPINNISTGLQLMAMQLPEGDPNQETIARLLQDCDRLADLIKSVLSFSRPTDYEMDILDLPTLLQRLLERLHSRITRLNIDYRLQIEPNCPPIRGNLRALEQVFTNLINNALQAMSQDGGNLTVKVQTLVSSEGHTRVEVSVADTGPGISKELQEHIFQPFFTTEPHGTGLGLAIAKRIITAHKGTINLTSIPGGTVFLIQIPAAEIV